MKDTQPLKLNKDFKRLYSRGKSLAGGFVVVYMQPTRRDASRVGFAVGKHFGNAVMRNRAKRLMRESYRLLERELRGTADMVIVARNKAAGKTYSQISRDLRYVLSSLGLISEKKQIQ